MAAPWMCALVTLPSRYETNCVADHQVLQEENKVGKAEDKEYSYQEGKKEGIGAASEKNIFCTTTSEQDTSVNEACGPLEI